MKNSPEKLSDIDIATGVRNGDNNATSILYKKFYKKVYLVAFFYFKDKYLAEDLTQDTFIRAIINIRDGKYNDQGFLLAWLTKIAKNICIDHTRKKTSKLINDSISLVLYPNNGENPVVFEIMDKSKNPEEQLIGNETGSTILSLVNKLPKMQKEVFFLRTEEDLPYEQIAKLKNINISTALGRMHYARIKLREMYLSHQM